MGVCGRFIDGLTDEQRDRLVRAQKWVTHCYGGRERRCLVGHAINYDPKGHIFDQMRAEGFSPEDHQVIDAFSRFDRLVARFGLPRIVRAVKLRAGATVEDLTDQPEPAGTAR